MNFNRFLNTDDYGFIDRKYILSFISIFCLLVLFLLIFFYFNIYLVILLLVIIAICVVIYFVTKDSDREIEDDDYEAVEEEDIIEDKVQAKDASFSLESFYVYVKDIVDLIGRSYSKNNVSFLNNFLGKDLIREIKTNIDNYTQDGYTRMITSINVRDCKLVNYYVSAGYEYFEVEASISKVDCSVQNGVVISGESTNGKFYDYNLVFCRSVKEYTPVDVLNCPNCGSDNTHFNSGKCMNCGQIVSNIDGFYLIKFDEF